MFFDPSIYGYYYFLREKEGDDQRPMDFWQELLTAYSLTPTSSPGSGPWPDKKDHRDFDILGQASDAEGDRFVRLVLMHDVWIVELILNSDQPPEPAMIPLRQECQRWNPAGCISRKWVYFCLWKGENWPSQREVGALLSSKDLKRSDFPFGPLFEAPDSGEFLLVSNQVELSDDFEIPTLEAEDPKAPKDNEFYANVFLSCDLPAHFSFEWKLDLELEEYEKFLKVFQNYYVNRKIFDEKFLKAVEINLSNFRLIFQKGAPEGKQRVFQSHLSQFRKRIAEKKKHFRQLEEENKPSKITSPLEHLPFPLAWIYRSFLNSYPPANQFSQLILTISAIIEYLGLITLADYRHRIQKKIFEGEFSLPTVDEAIEDEKIDDQLSKNKTLGTWADLTKKILDKHLSDIFIPELHNFFESHQTTLLELIDFRNKCVHGGYMPNEAYITLIREKKPVLKELIEELSFLEDYPLVYVETKETLDLEDKMKLRLLSAMGPFDFELFSRAMLELKNDKLPYGKALHIQKKKTGEFLLLHPFLLVEECEGCKSDLPSEVGNESRHLKEIFFFSCWRGKKALYKSYKTPHWHKEGNIRGAFYGDDTPKK